MPLREVVGVAARSQILAFEPHMLQTGACVQMAPRPEVVPDLKRYRSHQLLTDKTLTAR